MQGGSTITQQLVRALYIKDPKRDFERKIREAKLASELEEKHSKRWILHEYLNSVPYGTVGGRTAIGAQAAAVTFFDKHVERPRRSHEVGAARGPAAGALAVQPVPQPARPRSSAATRCCAAMCDNGYITAGRAREARPEAAQAEARHALHARAASPTSSTTSRRS